MRHNSGFSLIELLLVLAIVAAMSVAAFVVYPKVQAGRLKQQQQQMAAGHTECQTLRTEHGLITDCSKPAEDKQPGRFHSEFENGF